MQLLIQRVITGLLLGLLFWLSFIYLPSFYFSLILLAILCEIIIFEWKHLFDVKKTTFWLLMPFYPVLPFIFLILMNQDPIYRPLLLILFVLVASYDSGSYLVGSLIGKHKIAPLISPGKTWEGFIGGYIFACAGLTLLLYYLDYLAVSISIGFMLIFTLISCALSFSGDLFESWLKRRADIKDSGTLLPGHGGFLDRFDGILFAIFFFYLFKDQLVCYFFT